MPCGGKLVIRWWSSGGNAKGAGHHLHTKKPFVQGQVDVDVTARCLQLYFLGVQ